MFRSKHPKIDISMPKKSLEAIFDECDRHDVDETGGRIIGMYEKKGRDYQINVLGVIPPGPNARRSPTSFFQDGEYQERVFRELEKDHPNLEHLGNWHTHHVNGLQTLSGGDRETYHATVNHHNHNTDFFYALLVTRKHPHPRHRALALAGRYVEVSTFCHSASSLRESAQSASRSGCCAACGWSEPR